MPKTNTPQRPDGCTCKNWPWYDPDCKVHGEDSCYAEAAEQRQEASDGQK